MHTPNDNKQVVVVPHTLAWSVAPHKAHVVVVMGTEYYEGTWMHAFLYMCVCACASIHSFS